MRLFYLENTSDNEKCLMPVKANFDGLTVFRNMESHKMKS